MSLSADLYGVTALVTGASGSLGAADRIETDGGQATVVECDVTRSASVQAAFDAAEVAFGTVNVVVNNSGVAITRKALDLDEAEWDRVLDTNLKGAFLVAQAAARRMAAADRTGSIINITSIIAHRVAGAVAPYLASKAGLAHLTAALAQEWARYGIRVNALAPGYIETELNREFFRSPAGEAIVRRIPMRRLGQADDLDGALLLLASDASRYMTGSTLVVDGGHSHAGL